jgi:hypothetical protein
MTQERSSSDSQHCRYRVSQKPVAMTAEAQGTRRSVIYVTAHQPHVQLVPGACSSEVKLLVHEAAVNNTRLYTYTPHASSWRSA